MSPAISLVTVTYRSSSCLPRLLASARREAASAGVAVEIVVVDHSEDDGELARIHAAGADRVIAAPNRGYAAGVNRGIREARGGLLLVANPDVELQEGSLAALLQAGEGGDAVVGPLFILGGIDFPPADEQGWAEQVRRWRAVRSQRFWERHLAREVEAWRRVWEGTGVVRVENLSGALLLFSRALAERTGPWDERFFLFFEETDWIARARRVGARVLQVPSARVTHEWGHAARPAAEEETFLRSRRAFLRKRYGPGGALLANLVPRRCPFPVARWEGAEHVREGKEGGLWLVSPSPVGFPAARIAAGRDGVAAALALVRERMGGDHPGLVLAYDEVEGRVTGVWASR